jgi:hypothetical protein
MVNVPGLVIAKDISSKYSVISKDYSSLLGWNNPNQCIDLSNQSKSNGTIHTATTLVPCQVRFQISPIVGYLLSHFFLKFSRAISSV